MYSHVNVGRTRIKPQINRLRFYFPLGGGLSALTVAEYIVDGLDWIRQKSESMR